MPDGNGWEESSDTGVAPEPRELESTERLEDLVARIPAATREALEDLLRARFTRVRRLRDGELR